MTASQLAKLPGLCRRSNLGVIHQSKSRRPGSPAACFPWMLETRVYVALKCWSTRFNNLLSPTEVLNKPFGTFVNWTCFSQRWYLYIQVYSWPSNRHKIQCTQYLRYVHGLDLLSSVYFHAHDKDRQSPLVNFLYAPRRIWEWRPKSTTGDPRWIKITHQTILLFSALLAQRGLYMSGCIYSTQTWWVANKMRSLRFCRILLGAWSGFQAGAKDELSRTRHFGERNLRMNGRDYHYFGVD